MVNDNKSKKKRPDFVIAEQNAEKDKNRIDEMITNAEINSTIIKSFNHLKNEIYKSLSKEYPWYKYI